LNLRSYLQARYIYYGLSIVFSRGLELAVMFFAASYLTKAAYGELEYSKKVLEIGGIFLSFGFPVLILTYTRSKQSKVYLLAYAVFFTLLLAIGLELAGLIFDFHEYVPGMLFYALFFSGGIVPAYILVRYGSDAASKYKIFFSLLYWSFILAAVVYYYHPEKSFILVASALLLPGFLYIGRELKTNAFKWRIFKKYVRHYKKLLYGSLALVLSNFTNIMFLYTDIFVIRWFSPRPQIDIADYSFSLNAANVLMLIPFTLVQVDIEQLKGVRNYYRVLRKKIAVLTAAGIIALVAAYWILIHYGVPKYENTFPLFLLILTAKFFQAQGVLYGTGIVILKRYSLNLKINVFIVTLNILLNIGLFKLAGLYGVALASAFSLLLRYGLLSYFYGRYYPQGRGGI